MTSMELARRRLQGLAPTRSELAAPASAAWQFGLVVRYGDVRRLDAAPLAEYIESLDEEQFRRGLVFLRRAFGPFSAREKRHISENLGEYWGQNADAASEMIEKPLTEVEEKTLKDLNEFDFDV